MNKQESVLIRWLQRWQDKRAADELIRMYYKEIYTYVFRQVAEKEQSMDLTQDIFLSVLQSIWNYNAKKSGFRTWLYRIATCRVVDYYRSRVYQQDRKQIPLDGLILEEDWNVEQQVTQQEMVAQIFNYLKEQDGILEKIFRLRFYTG